jgi:hypothetical protein
MVEWDTLYCPNPKCTHYGIRYCKSQLVKNGSSHGQGQFLCKVCRGSVVRYGTAYYALETNHVWSTSELLSYRIP